MFSSLSNEISDLGLASAIPETIIIALCSKDWHTFEISERRQIINLHPTKSAKGGGKWKKHFLNYIDLASNKHVMLG